MSFSLSHWVSHGRLDFFPLFFADDGGQFGGTTAWQCWSSLGYRPRGNPGEKSPGAASIQLQQLRPCFSCFSLSSTIPRATSRLGLLVPETMIWSPGPHGREDWILLSYWYRKIMGMPSLCVECLSCSNVGLSEGLAPKQLDDQI